MKLNKLFLLALVFILVITPFILAHETDISHEESNSSLPPNLQKVADYNTDQANFYLRNLSFLIAFLAGILTLLTPCSLAILPAFFAYGLKEKKKITKRTFTFCLGFTPIFIMFGLCF